jgi:hypothetical protein
VTFIYVILQESSRLWSISEETISHTVRYPSYELGQKAGNFVPPGSVSVIICMDPDQQAKK